MNETNIDFTFQESELYRSLLTLCLSEHSDSTKGNLLLDLIQNCSDYHLHPNRIIVVHGTDNDYFSRKITLIRQDSEDEDSIKRFCFDKDPINSSCRIREGATVQWFESEFFDCGFYQVSAFHKGSTYHWACTDDDSIDFKSMAARFGNYGFTEWYEGSSSRPNLSVPYAQRNRVGDFCRDSFYLKKVLFCLLSREARDWLQALIDRVSEAAAGYVKIEPEGEMCWLCAWDRGQQLSPMISFDSEGWHKSIQPLVRVLTSEGMSGLKKITESIGNFFVGREHSLADTIRLVLFCGLYTDEKEINSSEEAAYLNKYPSFIADKLIHLKLGVCLKARLILNDQSYGYTEDLQLIPGEDLKSEIQELKKTGESYSWRSYEIANRNDWYSVSAGKLNLFFVAKDEDLENPEIYINLFDFLNPEKLVLDAYADEREASLPNYFKDGRDIYIGLAKLAHDYPEVPREVLGYLDRLRVGTYQGIRGHNKQSGDLPAPQSVADRLRALNRSGGNEESLKKLGLLVANEYRNRKGENPKKRNPQNKGLKTSVNVYGEEDWEWIDSLLCQNSQPIPPNILDLSRDLIISFNEMVERSGGNETLEELLTGFDVTRDRFKALEDLLTNIGFFS